MNHWQTMISLSLLVTACGTEESGALRQEPSSLLTNSRPTAEVSPARGGGRFLHHVPRDHPHRRKPHHDCTDDEPPTGTCNWSPYSEGLSGANVGQVLFDTRTAGLVYGIGGATLFKSYDSGASWQAVGGVPSGSFARLALDGPSGGLIAATSSGVARSRDGGATWTGIALQGLALDVLATSSTVPLRMYSSAKGAGVFRSDDGGLSWSEVGFGFPFGAALGLTVSPLDSETVLAAVLLKDAADGNIGGVVVRTSNGGNTWETVFSSPREIWSISRCPADPSVLLVAGNAGVARSRDDGTSWEVVNGAATTDVAISYHDCDDFFITRHTVGPLHTTDGGVTFGPPLTTGLAVIPQGNFPGNISIDPANSDRLVAATHAGIFVSTNAGTNWHAADGVLDLGLGLSVSPIDPSVVWAGTWGSGAWKRDSSATPWMRIPPVDLPSDYAQIVMPHPYVEHAVLVGTQGPLYISDDGEHFVATALTGNTLSAAFDPRDTDLVYVANQVNGIFRSTDAGHTWAEANGDLTPWVTPNGTFIDIRHLALDPDVPSTLYAGTYGRGLLRSTNEGSHWTSIHAAGSNVTCLLLVSGSPSSLYACSDGVWVSTDGGDSWSDISTGLPTLDVVGIAHDEATGDLYSATGYGVFRKRGSSPWQSVDTNCLGSARTPVVVREEGERWLVVAAMGGVYRRKL